MRRFLIGLLWFLPFAGLQAVFNFSCKQIKYSGNIFELFGIIYT